MQVIMLNIFVGVLINVLSVIRNDEAPPCTCLVSGQVSGPGQSAA